jgi:DNA-binding LacI/PurR family transcriptional regulator
MNRVPDPDNLPPGTIGAVLWPHRPIDTEMIRQLNQTIPVILVDHRLMGVSADCVRFDDVAGGRSITNYLLKKGHRNIAFLAEEVFAESVQDRWHGYALAHEEFGFKCDPRLSLLYQAIDTKIFSVTFRHLLSDPQVKPTAVVCSNDLVAFSLLRFLNAEGVRVPEDIAVTGYGNAIPDYMSAISLTTMDQPFYQMGVEAGRLLSERTRQASVDRLRMPRDICLQMSLVARRSA